MQNLIDAIRQAIVVSKNKKGKVLKYTTDGIVKHPEVTSLPAAALRLCEFAEQCHADLEVAREGWQYQTRRASKLGLKFEDVRVALRAVIATASSASKEQ